MSRHLARVVVRGILGVGALGVCGCGGPEEAPRVELPVVVDPSGITAVDTNLGYQVELTEARVMVEDIVFTIAGEAHEASLRHQGTELGELGASVIPAVHAHPDHYQGGDVTGELRGRFVLRWAPGEPQELGAATLLVGSYQSANFTFALAGADDGLAGDDPLLGHTAVLRGLATRDGDAVAFVAAIDSPAGRELVGAPFAREIAETTQEELGIRLLTRDPLEGDTLFDDIDFAALADGQGGQSDGDGQIFIDASATDAAAMDAYNVLRRTLQTHDHFDVTAAARGSRP